MRNNSIRKLSAFTLIEILITIVVISIAGTVLMGVYSNMVAKSADPIIQQQALAIAEAYMEEIRLKAFSDPDVDDETKDDRVIFDDIQDYIKLDPGHPAQDQNGNGINALSAYKVTVIVTPTGLGPIGDNIGPANSMRIDVVVSHPAIDPITLSSFRTSYF
jgi:MSHA pilin protein MshD